MTELAILDSELTADEVALLDAAELVIERGLESFVKVGEALGFVRDNLLYRAEHATFEEYCQVRWGLERASAYRAIQAAEVAAILSPIGEEIKNEAQARELAKLIEQPEKLKEAFTKAAAETNGKPTAAALRKAVDETLDPESALAREAMAAIQQAEARKPKPAPEPLPAADRATRDEQLAEAAKPAIQFAQLVSVCRDFVERFASVDLPAAAKAVDPTKSGPIHDAIQRLNRLREAMGVNA